MSGTKWASNNIGNNREFKAPGQAGALTRSFKEACLSGLLVSGDMLDEYVKKHGGGVNADIQIKKFITRWLERQNEVAVDGRVEQALVLWLDKNYLNRFSQ